MTAPRRVPTEVERAAAAVEAGHAWRHTANGRPGYATWPNIQPGDPSWWRRHGEEPPARPAPTRIEDTAGPYVHAVDAHPWQEYNAYGNTCHYPGCLMIEDEHEGEEPA